MELKNIRRSRVEMDVVPAVLFESFFIFLNFYSELWSQCVARYSGQIFVGRSLQKTSHVPYMDMIWSYNNGSFIMNMWSQQWGWRLIDDACYQMLVAESIFNIYVDYVFPHVTWVMLKKTSQSCHQHKSSPT